MAPLGLGPRELADGPGRQLAAIIASGDRTPDVGGSRRPRSSSTATNDRMVRPSGGRATGEGHPRRAADAESAAWATTCRARLARLIDAIADHAARATRARRRRPR